MTRDYAKRSNACRGRRNKQSNAGLWLFTVMLFILFTLGLVYLGQYHQHASARAAKVSGNRGLTRNLAIEQTLPIEEEKNEVNKKAVALPHNEQPHNAAPQFEFITPKALEEAAMQKITKKKQDREKQQLAQVKVQKQVVAQQAKAQSSAPRKEQYILEVMKAKSYKAVDRERAVLALIGIETKVIKIKEKDNAYYKLMLGPYGKEAALAKQQMLAKNKIKTIINKL